LLREGAMGRNYRRIKLLKRWKRLWESEPEEMEAARQRATEASVSTYRNRVERLKSLLVDWPREMSRPDIRIRCQMVAIQFAFKPPSLLKKLTRLKYVSYDALRGVWINNINCPLAEGDEAGHNGSVE
jgi:hypothetical protein